MAFRDFWINHAQCADNHSSSSVDGHRLIAPIYAAGILYAGGLLFGAILVAAAVGLFGLAKESIQSVVR
jgi:hypothetical protein